MTTPLRKSATVILISGIVALSCIVSLFIVFIFFLTSINAVDISTVSMERAEQLQRAESYAIEGMIVSLLALPLCLYLLWIAANLNKADTMLGEIFRMCPLCFGSDTLIWNIKFFTKEVLCRDCHAQWELVLSYWSSRLTRLSIRDYGNALSTEERSLVPDTDSPEHWYGWAKERFRRMRPFSPPPLASHGQTLFCRFCGHRNLPDAKFCSACGRELSGDPKA
jgi:hypothetical protein